MTDIVERLRNPEPVPFGQPPSGLLDEAADEIEKLRDEQGGIAMAAEQHGRKAERAELVPEIERLRAVITRAKDALLDGQSTQWVHDLLVAALVGPKP
jgi:hypothetical protein